MNDVNDLTLIIRSRIPIVVVETDEERRALELLEQVARLEGKALFVWTAADGMYRKDNPLGATSGSSSALIPPKGIYARAAMPDTRDVGGALKHLYATSLNGIYALLDVQPYLADPVNVRLLKSAALENERSPRTIVLVGHKLALPEELQRLSARFDLVLPDSQAIRVLIDEEAKRAAIAHRTPGSPAGSEEAAQLVTQYLAGMCQEDARRIIRQCVGDDGAVTMDEVACVIKSKKEMLGDSSVVEFVIETTRLTEVAGLRNLKRWLALRRAAFLGDAKSMGLDTPKGLLLLGVQGAGKSLAAKAVAGSWGVPLLRLDFATLYNKWLGETERNMREALKFADAMAPCVLWMDEIEKGVATSASDAGESRRVLGTILTWMAERRSKTFMVATANDIDHLPPELIRKGRFDEIFFVDLPDAEARAHVLLIHLGKRKLDPKSFDMLRLIGATDGFSGAEIEQAIVSALYEAHAGNQPLNTVHVLAEIARTRPLSVVMAEKIQALRLWAAERTVPAD